MPSQFNARQVFVHVGAKRLFGQPANACFCPCEEARFCEKKRQKWCNFWAPKMGAHFWTYNLQLQLNFLLKMVRGTKNGAQKWDPKMVPQKMKKCWQKPREIIAGKLLHWHAIATLDYIPSSVIGAPTKWWPEMHSEILATLEPLIASSQPGSHSETV